MKTLIGRLKIIFLISILGKGPNCDQSDFLMISCNFELIKQQIYQSLSQALSLSIKQEEKKKKKS